MSNTASVPSLSNIHFIAWMAASAPAPYPAHVCSGPAAPFISSLMAQLITFPTILRSTSPTPIGLIPGFLSRGMSRDDTYVSKYVGWYEFVNRFFAKFAISYRSSFPTKLKFFEHSIRGYKSASIPDDPADPFVRNAAFNISCSSMESKKHFGIESIGP